jgi:hypothetical protein
VGWTSRGGALLAIALATSSCGVRTVLPPDDKEFAANDEVLAKAAEAAGYEVDASSFRLTGADVRRDAITFQYAGVQFAGDHAWVVRFSEKSTEQDPIALESVHAMLPVLAEGRQGFEPRGEGKVKGAGWEGAYVRYGFQSPVHDAQGGALAAQGIAASIRAAGSSGPVVFKIKLDNHGDRSDLPWDALAPFLAPIEKG